MSAALDYLEKDLYSVKRLGLRDLRDLRAIVSELIEGRLDNRENLDYLSEIISTKTHQLLPALVARRVFDRKIKRLIRDNRYSKAETIAVLKAISIGRYWDKARKHQGRKKAR